MALSLFSGLRAVLPVGATEHCNCRGASDAWPEVEDCRGSERREYSYDVHWRRIERRPGDSDSARGRGNQRYAWLQLIDRYIMFILQELMALWLRWRAISPCSISAIWPPCSSCWAERRICNVRSWATIFSTSVPPWLGVCSGGQCCKDSMAPRCSMEVRGSLLRVVAPLDCWLLGTLVGFNLLWTAPLILVFSSTLTFQIDVSESQLHDGTLNELNEDCASFPHC